MCHQGAEDAKVLYIKMLSSDDGISVVGMGQWNFWRCSWLHGPLIALAVAIALFLMVWRLRPLLYQRFWVLYNIL